MRPLNGNDLHLVPQKLWVAISERTQVKKSLIAYPVTRSHIGYIYTQSISESFFQVDIFLKHFSYFGSIDILRVGIHFELHMLILNAAKGTTN